MTQVTIEEALQTMLYAAKDAIDMIYQHQHQRSNINHVHFYIVELQDALTVIAHACVRKAQQNWNAAAYNAAENYWGQYDVDGIIIDYTDGSKLQLRF